MFSELFLCISINFRFVENVVATLEVNRRGCANILI